MDPVQVMPEVAGWFDDGSEELHSELVKVFKNLMLKDAGFDILVRPCALAGSAEFIWGTGAKLSKQPSGMLELADMTAMTAELAPMLSSPGSCSSFLAAANPPTHLHP
jgi:hypothetical protein